MTATTTTVSALAALTLFMVIALFTATGASHSLPQGQIAFISSTQAES